MPDPWLPNAEVIGCAKGGGSYNGAPYRIVIHTVEGDPGTIDGCRALASSHGSPPQLWYHPRLRWLGQGLPLDRSGYALAHPSGAPETNKAGALQVEVFGFAADTPGWTVEADNLGTDVVGSIVAAGWPVDLERRAPTTGSDGYGSDGAVRGSWDQWAAFTGVCVHASVPGNDHWDAGDLDLERVTRAAGGAAGPQPTEDDDMPYYLFSPHGGGRWVLTDMRTNTRYVDDLQDALNVDWFLRSVAGVAGVVANRDAAGQVAGPIAVDDLWLEMVADNAAAGG